MSNNFLIYRLFMGTAAMFLGVSGTLIAAPVMAQGAQVIEVIVVTARKRSENAQDVPAAVAAFNAEDLEERGIDNIIEAARLTPNVTINETNGLIAGAIQVFIRGIGNDPGFDQGVGVYVDDVYLNRTTGALLDVYDVERIEILKGPQGHLYGRNTIGGAVKYVSAEPDNETRFKVEAKVGTDSLRRIRAGLSGAISEDKLFGSIAISKIDQDGYQRNLFNGDDYASQDKVAARGTLIWQATDSLRMKFVADMMDDDSDPYVPTRVAVQTAGAAGLDTFQALLSTANMFVPGAAYLAPGVSLDTSLPRDEDHVNTAHIAGGFDEYKIETQGYALTIDWDLNDRWSLKSITAGRELENVMPFDFDGTDQVFIDTLQTRDVEDFSQELQFNYSGDNINAVFGLYYLDGEFENESLTTQTPLLRLLSSHVKNTTQDDRTTESRSFYANIDWDLNDQWQLSVGGRYTKDEKDIDQIASVTLTQHVAGFVNIPGLEQAPLVLSPMGAQMFPMMPFFSFFMPHRDQLGNIINYGSADTVTVFPENKVGDDEWSEFTPSVKLSFSPNDSTMIYGGMSSGFKSGGFTFTGSAPVAPTYDPETVTTYVAGLKTTFAEGTVRLNIEAFLNDYEDKQVAVIQLTNGALVQSFQNVGEVESKGAEVELTWLPPIDGLVINLNIGWLDADIEEIIDQLPGTDPAVFGNIAGLRELGYSPELTWQARVQYTAALGDAGSLTVGVDANYRDEMYTDSPVDMTDPFFQASLSDDRTLTNAFLTWRSADERWRITLEGKNLSDERVIENTFNVSNFILGGYNRGRTWGLTLGYDMN